MEFTSIEKMAIIFFLRQIMEADSIIDPREISFLDGMFDILSVTEADLPRLEMMDLEYSKTILNGMPQEKLSYLKNVFEGMALSDNFFDPKERTLIESLYAHIQ